MSLSKLTEALEWDDTYVDAIRAGAPDLTLEPLSVVADAARKYSRLVEPCTTCNGTGVLCGHQEPVGDLGDPCPLCDVCAGSGEVPSEQAIKVGAKAMTAKLKEHPTLAPTFGGTAGSAMFWGVTVEEVVEAVILALLERTE